MLLALRSLYLAAERRFTGNSWQVWKQTDRATVIEDFQGTMVMIQTGQTELGADQSGRHVQLTQSQSGAGQVVLRADLPVGSLTSTGKSVEAAQVETGTGTVT